MFLGISDTIHTVSISIFISLINTNSRLAINVSAFLINSGNHSNNSEKDQKDRTLAIRYQGTIRRSMSLFLVNSVYKHIGSTHFWLPCTITCILTFAGTTNSSTSIIRTSTSIFTISLSKKLAYAFLSSKGNIHQYLNHLNH